MVLFSDQRDGSRVPSGPQGFGGPETGEGGADDHDSVWHRATITGAAKSRHLTVSCQHGRVNFEDWFGHHLPARWGATGFEVMADQDEILVVLQLGAERADRGVLADGEVARFRDATREERMALALAAEAAFGKKVSWGLRQGPDVVVFTTASVPVMTRLRLPERLVLDTLINGGVARTRSEALAWCVRLVGENEKEWLGDLRAAFEEVEEVRSRGPKARRRK